MQINTTPVPGTEDNFGLFIVIAKDGDANFIPAPTPRTYRSYRQARFVAYTLARSAPGVEFAVFKLAGTAVTETVTHFKGA